MMTPKQRSYLRARAHKLDPVAFIGTAGVTSPVLLEVDRQLQEHELIKIRVAADGHEEFAALCDQIAQAMEDAQVVQKIGHVLILFRPSLKKKASERIRLP